MTGESDVDQNLSWIECCQAMSWSQASREFRPGCELNMRLLLLGTTGYRPDTEIGFDNMELTF